MSTIILCVCVCVCVMNINGQLGDGASLTYEVHLLLWLYWLPAVEAELLAVIFWVYETPITSRDILLRHCQNLVSHASNFYVYNFFGNI